MSLKRKLIGLLALVLCSLPAWAEKADAQKPIEITADNGTLDQLKGVTVWRGNVIVNQGTLHATADEVTVTRDSEGHQTLHGVGSLATFRQKLDAKPGDTKSTYVDGVAKVVDYTSTTNMVVLTGQARVKRGDDVVNGEKIIYNTQTEIYQVVGGAAQGPNKGRVTVVIQPRDESSPNNKTSKP